LPAGQRVRIEFRSDPDPPQSGDNTYQVTVRYPDGTPVTDADVTAVFSMPAMPAMNMPAMRSEASLTHVGDGTYRGTGQLSMGGTWNVVVSVARGIEPPDTARFSIVAK
jgi:nitrogen fixation protein FixH